jgi:hypothetical protein
MELKKPLGRCCLKIDNDKGFRYILYVDLAFFVFVPRTIFSIAGLCDKTNLKMYVKMREITFLVFWPLSMIVCIYYWAASLSDGNRREFFIACAYLTILIALFAVDFHLRRVVNHYRFMHLQEEPDDPTNAGDEKDQEMNQD